MCICCEMQLTSLNYRLLRRILGVGSDDCFANSLRLRCAGRRCRCGYPVVADGLVNLEIGRLTDTVGQAFASRGRTNQINGLHRSDSRSPSFRVRVPTLGCT